MKKNKLEKEIKKTLLIKIKMTRLASLLIFFMLK